MRNSNGRIALIKSKLYTLFYSYLILLFIFLGEGKSQTFNVPTGSWATGILLTGISVALPGTVVDPSPVVFRIEDGFYTPADGYVDMTGCYAHGTAYWADHISRVVIEIKHITCPQGNKIYEIETLGYIYDQFGNFGYGANINEFEKEIWGLKIRTGIAQVPAFSPGVLFIRQGFTIMRKEKKGPGWRRPLTFPENIKNFPP
jgi:hypothetical protein